MSRKLTKKQKDFADEYIETGNGTKSALKAYNVKPNKEEGNGKTKEESTAGNIATMNLTKPNVIEYLKAHAKQASSNIIELSNTCDNPTVKLNANKDILDRSGFKPAEKVDIEVKQIDGFTYIKPKNSTST